MELNFPLFHSHLDLAHRYWKSVIGRGDQVIDATCGNGYDTQYLASLNPEKVYSFDIQEEAIASAKEKLDAEELSRVQFYHRCHSSFPAEIQPGSIRAVVYNLGYLPGGDKSKTTMRDTTLQSLNHALELIAPGGILSITCYPGHPEGKAEEEAILEWCQNLSAKEWNCCHHRFCNRKKSPSLLILQRSRGNAQNRAIALNEV